MDKQRLQLQSFLDSQLQQVEHMPQGQMPTFDKLQQKLNLIEKKLLNLKDHNIKARYHEESNIFVETSIIKKKSNQLHTEKKESKIIQMHKTPQKQLKIFSKTMSEGYFQFNTTSAKKTENKKYDSEKKVPKDQFLNSNGKNKKSTKTLQKIKELTNHNNVTSKKSLKFQRSKPKLNKTTHEFNLMSLQRDIQNCLKSNAQLKVKINHLQGYKTQYCRLKQVFLQCQKIRKKNRA